jgi:hypothetical protein
MMMFETQPELVFQLRAMWRAGSPASALLRLLDKRGLTTVPMIQMFEVTFGLATGEASPIGGWFADGTGELNDEQVDRLLAAVIEAQRSGWDTEVAAADS